MATHKSAVKRHRQSLNRRDRNRSNRTELRGKIKQLRGKVADKDSDAAATLLPSTIAMLDRSIQQGVLHENTAARTKSRLTRLVNSLKTA